MSVVKDMALAWAKAVDFPLVTKLSGGAGSDNVVLLSSCAEAERLITRLFRNGCRTLHPKRERFGRGRGRLVNGVRMTGRAVRNIASYALFGMEPEPEPTGMYWELHKNYILCQEFLPGNAYDTRITIIGNRAFGFRRFNRPDDFRTSGSGRIDYDSTRIDPSFIRLGFDIAQKLQMQSCALDGLWRGTEPVVCEVSYTFLSSAVHACPGHWDSEFRWHPGQMWPEEAEVADFLVHLP